jgi:hypothetical protein
MHVENPPKNPSRTPIHMEEIQRAFFDKKGTFEMKHSSQRKRSQAQ